MSVFPKSLNNAFGALENEILMADQVLDKLIIFPHERVKKEKKVRIARIIIVHKR